MKKENIYKFLYLISILFMIGFLIILIVDYLKYDPILNSAPFYAFIIVRAIEFLIPSLIVFIITEVLKKKSNELKAKIDN